ncbi:MAG TPA: hypothetical protein VFV78_04920 [Vicinamibacterales bacterium]|nr:hypothetical protein [Vicinamibacterales bacterium]
MTVLFYISGHGFGHASRDVEIMHALAALAPGMRLIIRSAVSPSLLARTLSVPYELRPGPCDTGIIQRSSIAHDDAATITAAIDFYERYDQRIRADLDALAGERPSIIVSDIAPLAFEAAAALKVPAIAIGNFTWDWIYDTHPGMADAAPWIPELIRASYAKATHALELPFSGGFEIFPSAQRVPLVARHATRHRRDTRAHLALPIDRPVALLSFGGYGLPDLNPGAVDCLDRWTVVTTDRVSGRSAALPRHLHLIEETAFVNTGFRYEDLVAAADVVVTKPGFGITAECISTGTAMLYTSRGPFREYDVLVREMPRYLRCRFIAQADLLAGRWTDALTALVQQSPAPERMSTDGAAAAARAILSAATANASSTE